MRLTILLLLFVPFLCYSQGVKLNVFDNVIRKQRIELDPVLIYASAKSRTALTFSSIGSNLYMQLSGSGWGAMSINEGDKLVLQFADGSNITVKSIGVQGFEPGIEHNTYHHQYFIMPSDLEALSQNPLTSIRKYSFKESSEIFIDKEVRSKVQRLSSLFTQEIAKAKLFKTLKKAALKDIGKYIGDSIQVCSKIYNSRYYQTSENKPLVFDVQSDFSDPVVNVIILEEDRKNFVDNPDKAYLNKDVCFSGVVMLRNNIPTMFLYSREQIKVSGTPTLQDVALYVGDSITVSGKVTTARYFSESPTQPTLLNIGAPFPNQPLTVVIEKDDRPRFKPDPEVFYLDKEIRVSGRVTLYRNKPQIVVRDKEQIKLLDGGTSQPTTVLPNNVQKTSGGSETSPQFPGGEGGWTQFLADNLKIPKDLQEGETKTVVASFYVDFDGSISQIQIKQSAGKEYDKEVLRLLNKMPRWKPKPEGNSYVGTTVNRSIVFKKTQAKAL